MLPNEIKDRAALRPEQLKRDVLPTDFDYEASEEKLGHSSLVGQERAEKVMSFGLHVNHKGYNIYVAGSSGVGKTSFTESIVAEFAKKEVELFDWCYVYNFEDSYTPEMLKLPVGMGKKLKAAMEQLTIDLKEDIPKAFNEESYQKNKLNIINNFQNQIGAIIKTMNKIAEDFDLMLRTSGRGFLTVPMIDGKPLTEEEYQKLDEATLKSFDEKSIALREKTYDHTKRIRELENKLKEALEELDNKVADSAAGYHIRELQERFSECKNVVVYLVNVKKDIIKNIQNFLPSETQQNKNPFLQLVQQGQDDSFAYRYKINLIVDNSETKGAPIVIGDNPSFYNLIGKAEFENRMGVMSTNFTKLKPGYLHQANGGYLIIQANDIFTKNFAWESLKHSLLNEHIQIENIGELAGMVTTASLKPDPIPLDVKVILIGNAQIYHLLYEHEEDFSKLFKIKVDFDMEMDLNTKNMNNMARFIHTHCEKHNLNHFDRTAIAQVLEYSLRLVGHQDKLSTQFNHLIEIIYEADTWAKMMHDTFVTEKHIIKAIEEREYRSSLYEEKIQENIKDGTILIDTEGFVVGQVNALSVLQLGQYSFGRPSRITASTYIGQKGIINIERESKLSGSIHNKGVYILGGYLGQTFAQNQRLSLTAHLAFEQSYGGVDGDSASSSELYALLSSLAEVPIDQSLAVTGSVNQKGMIQPIGGVNEKIEGFFEVCKQRGLTGTQGVLIPKQNVKNLMLNNEVIEAIEQNMFHVYEVSTIEEGLAILTGMNPGKLNDDGEYEENSIYRKVTDKLNEYAHITNKKNVN